MQRRTNLAATNIVSQRLPPNVFPLLSLPQEIVDMIYRQLIQDGQMAILRTSREVHNQASPLLAKHGIHRIRYKGSSLVPRPNKLRPQSAKKIQTVEVQMEFNGEKPLNHRFHTAQLSLRKPVVSDLCHVIARFDLFTSYWMLFLLHGQLTLFRTVIIEFRECLTPGFGECAVSDKSRGLHRLATMKFMHEILLGPSIWCDCGLAGARHLEFHPVRHLQIEEAEGLEQFVV